MKEKKIVIDIIRKKKNKINKVSNNKTDVDQDFLYNNDDLFAKNIKDLSKKSHYTLKNKAKSIPKISIDTKQLLIINKRSYLRLFLLIFIFLIFFSVNKLSNHISSTDINDLTKELDNKNKFYKQEISKLHQDNEDTKELSGRIDNMFEELSQLNSTPTIDELNDFEEELSYEIDELLDGTNELESLSDSNHIGNIDDDIRYNLN
ncbi:MAG: hypothetical protein KAI71_05795 [Candidatus Pacebacteria bacterium]|nr:hypothetical protein [Candidatus Paceibacterota bacterium]